LAKLWPRNNEDNEIYPAQTTQKDSYGRPLQWKSVLHLRLGCGDSLAALDILHVGCSLVKGIPLINKIKMPIAVNHFIDFVIFIEPEMGFEPAVC
jgi:hypothetical protein